MLDRGTQQRLDEITEDDLAGHRLRGLEHRPDIQPLDWRANSSGGRRRDRCVAEMRMKLIELPHLAIGSPANIGGAGVRQTHTANLLEPTRCIYARSDVIG